MTSEAYRGGYKAAEAGFDLDRNPHKTGANADWVDWILGWRDARSDMRDSRDDD